jgi:hypothetical protein
MKGRELFALPKRIPDEGNNRLSLSLGHCFGSLAILTKSPNGPKGTELAINPDDRVMEFILVTTVDQRFANYHGLACGNI